jgi:hypothetical protein
MQNDLLTNVLMLVAIFFLIYIIFSTMNITAKKEGFSSSTTTSSSTKQTAASSSNNGLAGNADTYTANIQSQVIKLQDSMLISKYRTNYENVIMAMDDLVDNLMLEKVLSIQSSNIEQGLADLVGLNNAKAALNNVMQFIDSSSS